MTPNQDRAVLDDADAAVVEWLMQGDPAVRWQVMSDLLGASEVAQEQVEKVQDGITDYLTEASPPISLRSAVVNAPGTSFLLITAGNVDDEGHAAAYIQAGASQRVTAWNVDGADHTGGYDTQPDDWQQRVVEFLDESLS